MQVWLVLLFPFAYLGICNNEPECFFCLTQEPGDIEEDFAQVDTKKLINGFFTSHSTRPPCIPKSVFKYLPDPPALPAWFTEQDICFYADKFSQKGYTGGLNYYRALNL